MLFVSVGIAVAGRLLAPVPKHDRESRDDSDRSTWRVRSAVALQLKGKLPAARLEQEDLQTERDVQELDMKAEVHAEKPGGTEQIARNGRNAMVNTPEGGLKRSETSAENLLIR